MDRLKVWIWYILFFLPARFRIGRPEEADCLYVQSFGRKMYSDQDLAEKDWLCQGSRWTNDQKFLQLQYRRFDAGRSNVELAVEAKQMSEMYNLPVLAQWEVAFVMWLHFPIWYNQNEERILVLWPELHQRYFSTLDVKKLSRHYALVYGWSRPMELANAWMLARATLVVAKIEGRLPIVVPVRSWRMDSDSTQLWTRAWWFWIPREAAARALCLLKRLV